jgi:hypothetical protein
MSKPANPSPGTSSAPVAPPRQAIPIITHELTVPYCYKHVTESLAREWNKNKVCPPTFMQAANHAYAAHSQGERASGKVFTRMLLELVSQTAATMLKTETTVQFLHLLVHNICSKAEEKGEKEEISKRKREFGCALADILSTSYLQVRGRQKRLR